MRIRLIFRLHEQQRLAPGLFQAAQLPPWNGFLPMLSSLAVHLVTLLILSTAAHQSGVFTRQNELEGYRVDFIKLRLPDPLYYRANQPSGSPKRPNRPEPSRGGQSASAAEGAARPAAEGNPGVRIPKGLELPPLPRTMADAPLIMQPEMRKETLPLTSVVPPLAFWARQTPEVPKPQPKKLIVPGRVEATAPTPQLAAPPSLSVPNQELTASDINIANALIRNAPALPAPSSTTVPVRLPNPAPVTAGGIERVTGEAANVIALSPTPVAPGEVVSVPKGLQNLPTLGDGSTGPRAANPAAATRPGSDGARGGAEDTGKNAPRPDRNAPAGAGRGASTSASPSKPESSAANGRNAGAGASGPANGAAADPARTGRTVPGQSSAAGNGQKAGPGSASNSSAAGSRASETASAATAKGPAAPAGAQNGADGVTRVAHPVGGNFDVVIMQSATREDLLDVGANLTGNPVYTVYLSVGDEKDWLMEYCIPARENARNNPYEVFIGDAATLTAPYPITTALPNGILGVKHRENIVFHGFLTVNGSFRNIEARVPSVISRQIAPLLNEWKFRPALKDRVPAEVEILLVVPSRI